MSGSSQRVGVFGGELEGVEDLAADGVDVGEGAAEPGLGSGGWLGIPIRVLCWRGICGRLRRVLMLGVDG